ncbi:MAG TPA: hypothetical protein VG889_00535 [Rhizomicrobium sp.]|nr:hypothetical protein [Rhizomicrobium sp.]
MHRDPEGLVEAGFTVDFFIRYGGGPLPPDIFNRIRRRAQGE